MPQVKKKRQKETVRTIFLKTAVQKIVATQRFYAFYLNALALNRQREKTSAQTRVRAEINV
jgi:hypothetical protein